MTTTSDVGAGVRLCEGEAHLWWARPDAFVDPAQLVRYRALLSEEERVKTDRYHFARDWHTCLMTRTLVRVTLSRYCDVAPERWRFRANDHGRPEIASPASPIRFNVSHTNGLIVCLVSRGREVGVDAESLAGARRWLDLAQRFFAPSEADALGRVRAADRPARFLEDRTLKESYIKARGLGLALPLDGFSFDLPARAAGRVPIHFTPAIDDQAARWQFTLERFGTGHLVATAIERHNDDRIGVIWREAVEPLI